MRLDARAPTTVARIGETRRRHNAESDLMNVGGVRVVSVANVGIMFARLISLAVDALAVEAR